MMDQQDPLYHNLQLIRKRIASACAAANRPPESVRLLLATKTVPAARIRLALKAGAFLIGENKVQEVKEKFEALQELPHEHHFIGHLQTNKIKDILKYGVSCVESLDRLDLAEKLHQRLAAAGRTMDVFIQVNTSGEASKFGVAPELALDLTRQVAAYDTLRIKGLMTIGLFHQAAEKVRPCFQKLKAVQQEINAAAIAGVHLKELSMGMSGDLEIAIAEGATIVRVGTAIFGPRMYPDSYYWNEGEQTSVAKNRPGGE